MLAMSSSFAETWPDKNAMSLSFAVTCSCKLAADKSSELLRTSTAAEICDTDKQMSDDTPHSSSLSLYKSAEIVSWTTHEMSSTLVDKNAETALS